MDNIKNKFFYRNQLDLIHNKLNKSNIFFEELNKLNKISKSLQIGIKRLDNIDNLILINNNTIFDKYLIKIHIIEYSDIKINYNNLFFHGLNNDEYYTKTIKLNNLNNTCLCHLICKNAFNNKGVLNMIENMSNGKSTHYIDFNKDDYINKLNKHIDDFNDFVNKYNLPDNFENIINNHYNILNSLYYTQLNYNKENEILMSKFENTNSELNKLKENINNYSKYLNETNNSIDNINLKLINKNKETNDLDKKILSNKNEIDIVKEKINKTQFFLDIFTIGIFLLFVICFSYK